MRPAMLDGSAAARQRVGVEYARAISSRLQQCLTKRGWSIATLAEQVGLNYEFVRKHVRGLHEPSFAAIDAYARALGCTPGWLAFGQAEQSDRAESSGVDAASPMPHSPAPLQAPLPDSWQSQISGIRHRLEELVRQLEDAARAMPTGPVRVAPSNAPAAKMPTTPLIRVVDPPAATARPPRRVSASTPLINPDHPLRAAAGPGRVIDDPPQQPLADDTASDEEPPQKR